MNNKREGKRLATLGFGIPNLLKFGEVGYFPEQFLLDFGLQGMTALEIKRFFMSTDMTALEIKRFFMSTDMNGDGDVITRTYSNTSYFVDFKHNVFIKYY